MTVSAQFARVIAGAYDNAGDAESYMAARSYRYWRKKGVGACDALRRAKADAEAGKARYAEGGLASYGNAPDDRGGRWIESPGQAGLRFVAWSDKILGRDYSGYFLDREFQEEVARGCVYQLPSRGGRPVYVEAVRLGTESRKSGWQEQCGVEGAAIVYLNCTHIGEPGGDEHAGTDSAESACRDAAHGADREAELMAEAENEYQESWREGQVASDKIEEARTLRAAACHLLPEYRKLLPGVIRDKIRESICRDLRAARRLYDEVRADLPLRANDAWREGFAVDWKGLE